ncbi:MAG: recombinase family protein [Bacteroidota bacterium]|nr:recombinase family protein [Bacteroidota bacterium]
MKTKNIDNRLLDFIKKADKKPLREGKGAVIYTRVSSKEQADNNTSLETQKRFCEEYCLKKGYPIKKYFGGTFESAKTDERKEFEKLIEYAKKERTTEAIIVYSYDRFSRSGANAAFLTEELQKAGIRLIAVSQEVDTTTPTGKFQKNIMLMFSQFDNDQRRDKSTTGMIENLRQGYWINSTPFGYTNLHKKEKAKNHKYIINKDGKLLKKAFELKAEARLTDKEIVKELNLLGCPIHYKSFTRILSNVFYCGYVTNALIPNEIYKGHHPPLVSEELFFKATNIIPKNSSKGTPKKFKVPELPLKTFAKDEKSLSPFTGYKQKGIYYYKTRHTGTCINVTAKHLNNLFIKELKKIEFVKDHTSQLQKAISLEINKKLKIKLTNRQQ